MVAKETAIHASFEKLMIKYLIRRSLQMPELQIDTNKMFSNTIPYILDSAIERSDKKLIIFSHLTIVTVQ